MAYFRSIFFFVALSVLIGGCSTLRSPSSDAAPVPPPAEREFRGVWVATVANIDWPSKPGLSTEEQQREARGILDSVVALGMNAVVFQVRPHADAMYPSSLEPWSYYLTGQTGKAPDPYYDPLAFWIEEAHDRGLELHAWFNPYRVHMQAAGVPNDSSIARRKPGIVRRLPGNMLWMDPGARETQEHTTAVIMDVVKRYDVDGIHFDDYFYPYGDGNFPDDTTWNAYVAGGGSLSRLDWRRANVNTLVERVYKDIKKMKPWVKFGLSPFGIWRPGNPPSISGFDQYNGLYADAKLWLNKGWVDYWTPQLYWPVNQIPQSYPVLLGWWTRENTEGRNIWPGLYTGRLNRDEKGADEIVNEIMIARGFVPQGPGHVHFSMKTFMRDSSYANTALVNGPYRHEALVPPSPWLDKTPPDRPVVSLRIDSGIVQVDWSHADPSDVFRWVVYSEYDGRWDYTIENRFSTSVVLFRDRQVEETVRRRRQPDSVIVRTETLRRIAVTAVDRVGNESPAVVLTVSVAPAAAVKQETGGQVE